MEYPKMYPHDFVYDKLVGVLSWKEPPGCLERNVQMLVSSGDRFNFKSTHKVNWKDVPLNYGDRNSVSMLSRGMSDFCGSMSVRGRSLFKKDGWGEFGDIEILEDAIGEYEA